MKYYTAGNSCCNNQAIDISTDGTFASPNDTQVPSTLAVKTYVDAEIIENQGLRSNVVSATLLAAGWVANEQTLTITGVTLASTNLISVQSIVEGDKWGEAKVYAVSQGVDSITFNCQTTPIANISFMVTILK